MATTSKTYAVGDTLTYPHESGWHGLPGTAVAVVLPRLLPGCSFPATPDDDWQVADIGPGLAWALAFLCAPQSRVCSGMHTVATTPPQERRHRWLNKLAVVIAVEEDGDLKEDCYLAVYLHDGHFSIVQKRIPKPPPAPDPV